MTITVEPIRALKDNYIWAIVDKENHQAVIIDPGEATPVHQFLSQHQLKLKAILLTHHHWDHISGAPELTQHYHVPIYGPANDGISCVTNPVQEPDVITIPDFPLTFKVLDIPAHTRGHIAYYSPGIVFTGDTLFSAGCGRLFEGTAKQMYLSLNKLASLPRDTKIYCGHEYTLDNLQFAKTVDSNNPDIYLHIEKVLNLKKKNLPSLPSTIDLELAINPFLRCAKPWVKTKVSLKTSQYLNDPIEVLAAMRRLKDIF